MKYIYLSIPLILYFFSSCQEENLPNPILEIDLNFGFENVWASGNVYPWRFINYQGDKVDSLNQLSGKYCAKLNSMNTKRKLGLVYNYEIPLPKSVDTVAVICKVKNISASKNDFYFGAHSNEATANKNQIIHSEILSIESDDKWYEYQIKFKKPLNISTFFFGIESIETNDLLIDDFEVKFDDVSIIEFPFCSPENIELLNKYTQPIINASLEEDVDDLRFLRKLVNDKKVLGLGESNHGTHEIFKIKNRIVKYLVENEGFNTIVFESNMDNLYHVNEYITNEDSDLDVDSIMDQFIHLFQTEEIKTLVEWLKKYNADKPNNKKVYFLGCDMQDDAQSIQFLKSFADVYDKVLFDFLLAYEQEYKVYENLAIIKQIQEHIESNKNNYDVSELKIKRLEQSAFLLKQFAIFDANLGNRSIHRDSSMANNLLWILDTYEDRKVIYWADNFHTRKDISSSAGGFLDKILKEDYYVISFHLSKGYTAGKFSRKSILSPRLFPRRPQYYLNAAPDSIFFLDAKDFCKAYSKNTKTFDSMQEMCEHEFYDAILHIKHASPAQLLKFQ